MSTSTKSIAGHPITLTNGERYRAYRNMAKLGRTEYTIKIEDDCNNIAIVLPPVDYNLANDFLNEFNNGQTSFDGRIW